MKSVIPVPDEILDFVRAHTGFVVLGHKEPDGDCISSQVGVGFALSQLDIPHQLVSPGPFDRNEIASWQSRFSDTIDMRALGDRPAAIVVDCSSSDRIEPFADAVSRLPTAVIDHHTSGRAFGDAHFVRPEIPANVILVIALIQALNVRLTPEAAETLFLGLATDTGFFRFIDSGGAVAFEAAAILTRAGASPRDVEQRLSAGRSFNGRALIGRMLTRVEQIADGHILMTWQSLADEREFGTRRDTDTLYRLLLDVERVEAIAVIKEKEKGCTVSFRSTRYLDVGQHATKYNGGGHQRASGAFLEMELTDAIAAIRNGLTELGRQLIEDSMSVTDGSGAADSASTSDRTDVSDRE